MIRFGGVTGANDAGSRGITSRVLVIFPGALGDLICLAPTLGRIARRHPQADLELMARDELAQFAVGRLGIRRAHSIDRREVSHLFRGGGDEIALAQRFFGPFERIYCFFGARIPGFRSALGRASREHAVSFHHFRPPGEGHVAEAYLGGIGEDARGALAAELSLLRSDVESAARRLGGLAEPGKFVAIFPGSGSASKNWPLENFAVLAKSLEQETRVLFVLGPAEAGMEHQLARAHGVLRDLPLGTVAAVARFAKAFVGVDSGVSHLASAAGTPGVVLFGPTDPARWRPLGKVRVVHRDPISAIEPVEVMAELHRLGIG